MNTVHIRLADGRTVKMAAEKKSCTISAKTILTATAGFVTTLVVMGLVTLTGIPF